MNKTLIYALLSLSMLGFINSQSIPALNANTSIVTISVNSLYSSTIKLSSAYAADTYIVGLLGQSYYDRYVNLSGGSYFGNTSHVYFAYSVPFINGSQSSSLFGGRRLGITVTLDGNRVTNYIGPSGPLIMQVGPSNAIDTAMNYGLLNDTARLVGLFGTNTTSESNYSIAWAVISHNAGKGQNYYGVYVDAITGKVVGEFYYLPYLMQNSSSQGYGTAGNFSLFLLTPLAENQSVNNLIYYVLFGILALAAIIAWIKFKPKKKSRFTGVMSGASS